MAELHEQYYPREATEADVTQVQELALALYTDASSYAPDKIDPSFISSDEGLAYIQELVTDETSKVFLSEDSERPVGFIGVALTEKPWRVDHKQAEIEGLFVLSEYRKHGIGKALLEAAEGWSRANGAQTIFVSANYANTSGIRFYEHEGMAPYEIILEKGIAK